MKNKTNYDDYRFKFSLSQELPSESEPEFLSPIGGQIYCMKGRNDTLVGKLSGYFVHLDSGIRSDYYPHEIIGADMHVAQCSALYEYDENKEYVIAENTVAALSKGSFEFHTFTKNFMYLDRLEIVENHRGSGVGCHFLYQIIRFCDTAFSLGFYALIPSPLQFITTETDSWTQKLKLENLNKDKNLATEKLRELYSGLGFVSVEGTEIMVRPADM